MEDLFLEFWLANFLAWLSVGSAVLLGLVFLVWVYLKLKGDKSAGGHGKKERSG